MAKLYDEPLRECALYVGAKSHWKKQWKLKELENELWEPALTILQRQEKLRKFFPMCNSRLAHCCKLHAVAKFAPRWNHEIEGQLDDYRSALVLPVFARKAATIWLPRPAAAT